MWQKGESEQVSVFQHVCKENYTLLTANRAFHTLTRWIYEIHCRRNCLDLCAKESSDFSKLNLTNNTTASISLDRDTLNRFSTCNESSISPF